LYFFTSFFPLFSHNINLNSYYFHSAYHILHFRFLSLSHTNPSWDCSCHLSLVTLVTVTTQSQLGLLLSLITLVTVTYQSQLGLLLSLVTLSLSLPNPSWDWSVTCHPSHCHYPISAGIALVTPVTVTTQSQLGFLCDSISLSCHSHLQLSQIQHTPPLSPLYLVHPKDHLTAHQPFHQFTSNFFHSRHFQHSFNFYYCPIHIQIKMSNRDSFPHRYHIGIMGTMLQIQSYLTNHSSLT